MTTQGKRLKNIRQALNLTQTQLGEKLGISKQFYSNIETDRTLLNNDKLVLLFKYFNVNLNYLLCGAGSMFNKSEVVVSDTLRVQIREVLREEGLLN